MVLVDTPVWSVALRRRSLLPQDEPIRLRLAELIRLGEVHLVGAVRQELLSGVRARPQFLKLRDYLRRFQDVPLTIEDYEAAAETSNRLRSAGIANSPVDALLCAVALLRKWTIFSTDADFSRYASVVPIELIRIEPFRPAHRIGPRPFSPGKR